MTESGYSFRASRLRVPLGFLLAALYLYFTPGPSTTALTVAVGTAVALVGLIIRAWASGHIAKLDRLATTGPYAHVRNPLYLGSFLLAAGFAIAAHWALLLPVIAFWVLVYGPTMQRERDEVREKFPVEFDEYERHVPAFVPRARPWHRESGPGSYSLALYLRHGEWKAALGFAFVLGWIVARMLLRR